MTMFRRLLSSNLGLQGTDSATTVDLLVCIEAYCSPCETMPSVESGLSELVESCVANGISADGFDILDFLFGEAKFTGNRSSYGSSTNSMLVSVLETRRGIPCNDWGIRVILSAYLVTSCWGWVMRPRCRMWTASMVVVDLVTNNVLP